MKLKEVTSHIQSITDNVEKVIKGKRTSVQMSVAAFLCGGHILVEDVPGVGKTVLARAIARSVNASFKRIQFTPDLLPSDITGVSLFNQKTRDFEFSPGPVFANIVLADEINRTTPRTQSALLEAMDEHQVTVDGQTHELPNPFFVIATQNPMEYHGTYPLPEGQLDRFLMSIDIGYPSASDEKDIVQGQQIRHPIDSLKAVVRTDDIVALREAVKEVYLDPTLVDYIIAIITETRNDEGLMLGASPRGSLAVMRASQGMAAIQGRDFVTPDDVKSVAPSCLKHRIFPKPQLRMGKNPAKEIVLNILKKVPVPV